MFSNKLKKQIKIKYVFYSKAYKYNLPLDENFDEEYNLLVNERLKIRI